MLLVKYSYAFVILRRRRGTLDEMFEAITPNSDPQDQELPNCDHGTDYCDRIIPFIDKMAKAGMIAPPDLELVHATDSVDDAIAHIVATQSSGLAFTCLDECGRTHVGWENAVYRRLSSH
jgi:predicted Rossmann-fold nucleotide-binding protein